MQKTILIISFCFFSVVHAQNPDSDSTFWNRMQWGGTGALNISNNFTSISVSPQAIYPLKSYFATGVGLQYSYLRSKNNFTSHLYGGSWLNIFTPIPEVQISTELEQLRVNNRLANGVKDDFWNTALFLGIGYRQQNFTIGIRYNVLFDEDRNIYPRAWMPFVRVFF
ncbi:hypothetical protein [Psychroflexus planctonicus]|uniref:Alpha-ketoglutarate decarboxylase n=1 Tax=Psychroflexus planctonicus TaxID=1526575 RepID=A0ABQ1SGH6_9FLAO|nr:hypothetical protein [Psychroflexus planctonicus]GGE33425.1 hypothetical protein GCM10010832_12070 [Psychroflexus planctonicus]